MRSLRQAINAKCRECIHDKLAPGNWRQQVMGCAITRCPLHPVRPVSTPETRAERERRLAKQNQQA